MTDLLGKAEERLAIDEAQMEVLDERSRSMLMIKIDDICNIIEVLIRNANVSYYIVCKINVHVVNFGTAVYLDERSRLMLMINIHDICNIIKLLITQTQMYPTI